MQIKHPENIPLGMPSPKALQIATDAIRRRYVLPETMEHPAVRAECLRLAYLIQAYGLARCNRADDHIVPKATPCGSAKLWQGTRVSDRRRHDAAQRVRMPELIEV